MYSSLDGPTKSGVLTNVSASVPVEVRAGATAFEARQVVTLQGDGRFYVYLPDDNETVTQANVAARGFTQFRNAKETYGAAFGQRVFVMAVSGTVNVRFAERG